MTDSGQNNKILYIDSFYGRLFRLNASLIDIGDQDIYAAQLFRLPMCYH